MVLTGDRGLCGGFNANLMRRTQAFGASTGRETVLAICGRKGQDFFKRRSVTVGGTFPGAASTPATQLARAMTSDAVRRYLEGEVDGVYLLFNQFRSALSQVPTIERLLPIEAPVAAESGREYLYEPNRDAVIEQLLPRYVEVKVFQAVLESIASEHGARMTAMESATKNASEMIERLTLDMNRARQAAITKELMEIVGGAEALKG
jgi:F-type H+-transporting ATPase subunit gamma